MYHGQEIIGLFGILCRKRSCYSDVVGVAVLVKISAIVAVGKIGGIVVGLVTGRNLWRIWKYNSVAGLERVEYESIFSIV